MTKKKLTVKSYMEMYAEKSENNTIKENWINKNSGSVEVPEAVSIAWHRADEIAKEIEELPTVNIQYWIGSRKYYEKAIKIGKFYFQCGRKMTKSRGFVSIMEIEEITEKQSSEMLADINYY